MSHFSVLVIVPPGKSLKEHLQPFHEFECTGEVDQYVVDVDMTEEVRAQIVDSKESTPGISDAVALAKALEYFGWEDAQVEDESEVDRDDEHKFGFAIVKDGQLLKAVKRTNPNKKWDWWEVDVRRGRNVASALWQSRQSGHRLGSRLGRHDQHGRSWCRRLLGSGDGHHCWSDLCNLVLADGEVKAEDLSIDQAREQYHAQEVVADTKEMLSWMRGAKQLEEVSSMLRGDYVAFKGKDEARTLALLDAAGNWIEPGEMGWFGMSSDTPDSRREFTEKFWQHVRDVPADHTVAVVDCHI